MTSLAPTVERQTWQVIQAVLKNTLTADELISAFATITLLVVLTEYSVANDQLLHLRGNELYMGTTELKPLFSRLHELQPDWERLYRNSPQAAAQKLQDTFRSYLKAEPPAPGLFTLTR